jgi:hypothetical protein
MDSTNLSPADLQELRTIYLNFELALRNRNFKTVDSATQRLANYIGSHQE